LYSESESSDDGGQENGRPGLDCDDVNKASGSKKSGGSNQTAEFDWEDGYYTGYADPRYDEWKLCNILVLFHWRSLTDFLLFVDIRYLFVLKHALDCLYLP
jgi:hypothetical protein